MLLSRVTAVCACGQSLAGKGVNAGRQFSDLGQANLGDTQRGPQLPLMARLGDDFGLLGVVFLWFVVMPQIFNSAGVGDWFNEESHPRL